MIRWTFASLLAFAAVARGDSYRQFQNYRVAEATGRFYVVVKERLNAGTKIASGNVSVDFEIAGRNPVLPPIKRGRDDSPNMEVRAGDIVVGRGFLECVPSLLLPSSRGWGFSGIDVRGDNFPNHPSSYAVIVVGADGRIMQKKTFYELFSKAESKRFDRSWGGFQWRDGGWIDENRREVVVFTVGSSFTDLPPKPIPRIFRAVHIDTGVIRNASSWDAIVALAEGNVNAYDNALDLTAEMKLIDAMPYARRILADPCMHATTRVRAATALAAFGDKSGAAFIRCLAQSNCEGWEDAVRQVPTVLEPGDALTVLAVVSKSGKKGANYQVMAAFESMEFEPVAAVVIPRLRDKTNPADRVFMAEFIVFKGPPAKEAIPALVEMVSDSPIAVRDTTTCKEAAHALASIGPGAICALPQLVRHVEREAPDTWRQLQGRNANASSLLGYDEVNPFAYALRRLLGQGWIDLARREAVVVAYLESRGALENLIARLEQPTYPSRKQNASKNPDYFLRAIHLDTGVIRSDCTDAVIAALVKRNQVAVDSALAVISEQKLNVPLSHISDILVDQALRFDTRLAAADALATLGDHRGAEFVKSVAQGKSDDRDTAICICAKVLAPAEALAFLAQLTVTRDPTITHPVESALRRVPFDPVAADVIRRLRDKANHADRIYLTAFIKEKGPLATAAVPVLIELLEDRSIRPNVADALGAIGPADDAALPHLVRHAERDSASEWTRIQKEAAEQGSFEELRSDDEVVDAICRIKR